MKKLVLLPLIIAFFTSCKKDGANKVTYPASDSIYLVSTVTESNTNLVGTETFTYDSQHRIIKDVINNSLQITYTNPTFYTFIYNTDGTLASMTYTVNGNLAGKYDFSYQNGLPVSFYPDNNPALTCLYTVAANVTRINYTLGSTPTPGYTEYYSYASDISNNITNTVYVNKSPDNDSQFVDSVLVFHTYNSHKNAFYYANINFVLLPGFIFLPQPGKNMTSGRVENDFNVAGSDFATITADSATYNKADMPLKVTRYSGNNIPAGGETYTYIEVKN